MSSYYHKCIIFSAPSGAGKTTIVRHLLSKFPQLAFSVSACSREMRGYETDGKDYYFLGIEGFKKAIEEDAFVEYEEVYKDNFYGTLKSELERIWNENKVVIFDVDVVGGMNIKNIFKEDALAIFVQAPSVEILEQRLRSRQTETEEKINTRIKKATHEMSYANQFDKILVNEDLEIAQTEAEIMVAEFLSKYS
jgi:guanylate kinase